MDIMSDSKEKTPTVSPDPGATGETATSDSNGKERWRRALILEFNKIVAEPRVNNDNDGILQDMEHAISIIKSNALQNGWFAGPDKEKDKVTEKNN